MVDDRDIVRNLKHRGAARHQLLVEKRVAQAIALFGVPVECGLEHLPIGVNLSSQRVKGIRFFGIERALILVENAPGLVLDSRKASPLSCGPARIGREQKVANVGAGEMICARICSSAPSLSMDA